MKRMQKWGRTLVVGLPLLAMLSACNSETDYFNGTDPNATPGVLTEFFDYSTTQEVTVNITYNNTGQTVRFEIYDVNPMVNEGDHAVYKRSGITAFAGGLTDAEGKYTGTLTLPSSMSTFYIFTNVGNQPYVLKATRSGNTLTATVADQVEPEYIESTTAGTRAAGASSRANIPFAPTCDYCKFLTRADDGITATWDKGTGVTTAGYFTTMDENELTVAQSAVSAVLKEGQVPAAYLMGTDFDSDLKVNTTVATNEGGVKVTYVYGYSSSYGLLAYYCYTGKMPSAAEIAALPKGIVFANTLDANYSTAGKMVRGTTATLKYLDAEGNYSDTWPEGAKVGFVLYNKAFSDSEWNLANPYYSSPAGTKALDNVGDGHNGVYNCCSTFSYTYNGTEKTLLGFEDWAGGDTDFNDVVLQVSGVFPTKIVTDGDEEVTTSTTSGLLAFEDNWPAKSDFDMNDVVVTYTARDIFTEHTKWEAVKEGNLVVSHTYEHWYTKNAQKLTFNLTWTGAAYGNGFGFEIQLDDDVTPGDITLNGTKLTTANYVDEGNNKYIIYLFDNARTALGVNGYAATNMPESVTPQTYEVVIPYSEKTITTLAYQDKAPFNPFITINGDKTKEVHLIDHAPTQEGKACAALFGTSDDVSDGKKEYYRSSDYFPFAYNLNADGENADVLKMNVKHETKAINVVYPNFVDWAKSQGKNNTDWWNHYKAE